MIEHRIDRAINFPDAPGAVGYKDAVRPKGRDAEAQRAKKRETSANISEAQQILQRAAELRLAQAAAAKEAAERTAKELEARPSPEEIAAARGAATAAKAAAVEAAAAKALEKARLKAEAKEEAKAAAKAEKVRRREEARAKREEDRAAALAARPPKKAKVPKKNKRIRLVHRAWRYSLTPGTVHHMDQNGMSYDCDGNQLPPLCGEGVF